MRTAISALLVGAIFFGHAAWSTSESETLALENRVASFAAAFREADVSTLRTMLAPTYVHTNSGNPPIGREEWLGYVASRREELTAGALQLTRYANEDLRFSLYGDVAIVTGVNVSEGVRRGVAFSTKLRFTQVWVKVDGSWLRAAFQDAAVAP